MRCAMIYIDCCLMLMSSTPMLIPRAKMLDDDAARVYTPDV